MNYDFENKWLTEVVPLLDLPIVKQRIRQGINDFIDSGNAWNKDTNYDENRCPASYGRSDWWFCYVLGKFRKDKGKELVREGIMLSYKDFCKDRDFNMKDDDCYEEYYDYQTKIFEPYVKEFERTDYRSHMVFSACHWWNPTFGITIARILFPDEKWRVVRGELHTTVVNKNMTKVFDIIYYDKDDKYKGGLEAIKITHDNDEELFDDYFDDDELSKALGLEIQDRSPEYGEKGFNIRYKYDAIKDVVIVKLKYLKY